MRSSDNQNKDSREKEIVENLARACELLPENKLDYLIGYAEGVAAMADRQKDREEQKGEGSGGQI